MELNEILKEEVGLQLKKIFINKYAYYKHIGPYSQLKQAGQKMREELQNSNLETCLPYIEIYGHWTNDESKLETELLMCVK